MLLSVKMKNEVVNEQSQTRVRAGLGVIVMIDIFICNRVYCIHVPGHDL